MREHGRTLTDHLGVLLHVVQLCQCQVRHAQARRGRARAGHVQRLEADLVRDARGQAIVHAGGDDEVVRLVQELAQLRGAGRRVRRLDQRYRRLAPTGRRRADGARALAVLDGEKDGLGHQLGASLGVEGGSRRCATGGGAKVAAVAQIRCGWHMELIVGMHDGSLGLGG